MKLNIRKSWTSSLPHWAVFTVLFAQALPTPAQEPRLSMKFGRLAQGYVAGMVQGNNGEFVISGEFAAPGRPRSEWMPAITVMDQAGQVRRRLAPPDLSVVRAVLPQGGYIVADNLGFPPRLVLNPDGTPDPLWGDLGYPSLSGQIAVHPNQGVLMARNPWDPDRFAAIERLDFQRQPSAYDPSFGSNVFNAWPLRGLSCVRMAIAEDSHVWAWLNDGKVSRLFRFLPDGRTDPQFKPVQPVESFFTGFNGQTLLGPERDGSVVISAWNANGTVAARRLRTDGSDDPDFDASRLIEPLESGRPLLPLSDGSMLFVEFRSTDDESFRWLDLGRIAANGHPVPEWHPDLPFWWKVNGWLSIDDPALLQTDGKILMVLRGFRTSEVARFNPDGSPDPTFDSSILSPTPLPAVRLSFSGLQAGKVYWLESNSSLSGGEWQRGGELSGDMATQPGPHTWSGLDYSESLQFWRLREAEEPH